MSGYTKITTYYNKQQCGNIPNITKEHANNEHMVTIKMTELLSNKSILSSEDT